MIDSFERAVEEIIREADFRDVEIVERRARRTGRSSALTLIVDRPSGVDLALCERIAARINHALATSDEPYTLEVESPGLDRPLLRPADYERFRDRAVRIVTTLPVEGAKTHRGTLAGVRGHVLILRRTRDELPIPLEMIKHANLEFDPRDDLRREKRERKDRQ